MVNSYLNNRGVVRGYTGVKIGDLLQKGLNERGVSCQAFRDDAFEGSSAGKQEAMIRYYYDYNVLESNPRPLALL
jgi:hypothetical protein